MAFGQPSGPPATARQLRDLTTLLEAAGHADFRDARGPLGLNQRQAGGRFTQDEAALLITRLEAEAEAEGRNGISIDPTVGSSEAGYRSPRVAARASTGTAASRSPGLVAQLQRVPEELLVDELRRRGWALIPPSLAH
jgi:hypothetical protein